MGLIASEFSAEAAPGDFGEHTEGHDGLGSTLTWVMYGEYIKWGGWVTVWRNNNPGNIKLRDFTRTFTDACPRSYGDLFAILPTPSWGMMP